MSKTPKQAAPSAVSRHWKDMTMREKLGFVGKSFIFFLSGGFIYPTLWCD